MSEHDDIQRRLEAVKNIDWGEVTQAHAAEYYSDWIHVGPVQIMTVFHPDPAEPADGIDAAQAKAVADFIQHAAADIRRLLAERTTTVTNPIYGKPPEGDPIKLLSDAIEVMRPNGEKVVMDLVALADVTIKTERALAEVNERIEALSRRVSKLESKSGRLERAGRILAGGGEYEEPDEDLEERVRALERRVEDENLSIKDGRDD